MDQTHRALELAGSPPTVMPSYPRPPWKRLIRCQLSPSDAPFFAEPDASVEDVGLAFLAGSLRARVIAGDPLSPDCRVTDETIVLGKDSQGVLLSPLPRERIGAARCLGMNYLKRTEIPVLFYKPQTAISDPHSDILIPYHVQDQSDYEIECAVILGRDCKDVSVEDALDFVAGYTLANDVTASKSLVPGVQWGLAKSFDTWLPLGPCIVSAAEIPDPREITLTTHLNGERRQHERVAALHYSIPELISHLSKGTTLPAGSIICTGSPRGLGAHQEPPCFLKDGDEVNCHGSHGLGTLRNTVRFERLRAKL